MKTRRLFWKLFVVLWLAQLATVIGVGLLIWSLSHTPGLGEEQAAQEQRQAAPQTSALESSRLPPPPPRSLLPLLIPISVGSVVSLLFAWWLAGYLARPIRALHEAFAAAAGGQLETRIGTRMGNSLRELLDLGAGFDHMAERLQQLVESQRRLLHDVSHELRSPLARLQVAVELLQQQPTRAPQFAERILRDTARIDALVGELLTLARLEAGTAPGEDEVFDLGEVLAAIVEDVGFEAEAKSCPLLTSFDTPLPVRGKRELLHRALENIVRNALQYSTAASRIELVARGTADSLIVTVSDRGPGVPEADLAAIFEPFFRSATRTASGHGLGLAIARQVVLAQGGNLRAANRPGGGLLVRMELPTFRENP